MRENKLTILHTESSCGWGGQEIRILTESARMVERGHTVYLICPEHAPISQKGKKHGLRIVNLPIEKKKLKGLFAIRRWLLNNKVDVINTHSSTDSWLTALACKTIKHSPPIVRTRHVSSPISNNAPTRWLYTKAADFIVVTGEQLRETMINVNHYPADKIRSITTGIDDKHFAPGEKIAARKRLGLPEDAFIVGIVATLRSWKGHKYLIDAFSRGRFENSHLLIVGDGPQWDNISNQVSSLGLEERVTMPGNQDDVVPWLHSLDVFILPSYANEGFPQSIVQAMLCQIPVIATPIGSTAESVKHEHTGLLIEPENVDAIVESIGRLYADSAYRAKLASDGRAQALASFTRGRMLSSMENVFFQVIESKQF